MGSENGMYRREFLNRMGAISAGMVAGGYSAVKAGGAENGTQEEQGKVWEAVSDRKVRVGLVGYGECRFGAQFGFQDHPNVEVVAVSDLIPERRKGLMKACRCDKSYESLEKLVKDKTIEAVFVATDAPSHARHCMEVMNHDKHVLTAVPAVLGSLKDADKLLETVKSAGMKYMMAETSVYRANCYAMRQIYNAGGFGKLIYSEGEYYHYHSQPIGSFRNWRKGMPPLWYPTHSTAYYVGVTGGRLTSVSCAGFKADFDVYQPGANKYGNEITDEIALFDTSEGGVSRMLMCKGVYGLLEETGRVFGEKGYMEGLNYHGAMKEKVDITRPALAPGVPAGGHGGSHGRLMNEFITSILEDRKPIVDVHEALAMTVPGIIAHASALRDGERMKVPQYD